MMNILVTGAAGFIGFHVSHRLIKEGYKVTGIDNLNPYYDVSLKTARLNILKDSHAFSFYKIDIENAENIREVFDEKNFSHVIHLAAQAGVRYSISHPESYIQSNIVGFMSILEACRFSDIQHLVYASSSSVYGANTEVPFRVDHNVDHPVSLYAATKKSNELAAHCYSHLYEIPTTGLRFFTVYGPWGRPDMALFLFTDALVKNKPIDVYNFGNMKRDFTYIDDIVEGVYRIMLNPPAPSKTDNTVKLPGKSSAPYRILNIGHGKPVSLMDYIKTLETCTGKKARMNLLPMQPGDVYQTWADTSELEMITGYKPQTTIDDGIEKFVNWYTKYYNISL